MPTDLTPSPADFADVFAQLDALTRTHLVRYRVEIGRLLVASFFGGDVANYRDTDRTKETSLTRFAEAWREPLADLGLSETVLRQSILAYDVVQHLPAEDVERLLLSHYVALARLGDVETRRAVATLAADSGWTVAQTRDAVARVLAGQWVDADLDTPGLQPAPPDAEARPPQVGRVIRSVERVVDDLGEVVERWERAPRDRMSPLQRDRLRAAIDRLRAMLDEVEGGAAPGA